jgi:hypothetical protein
MQQSRAVYARILVAADRSIDQHMHTSNRRRTAPLSIWLNAGR